MSDNIWIGKFVGGMAILAVFAFFFFSVISPCDKKKRHVENQEGQVEEVVASAHENAEKQEVVETKTFADWLSVYSNTHYRAVALKDKHWSHQDGWWKLKYAHKYSDYLTESLAARWQLEVLVMNEEDESKQQAMRAFLTALDKKFKLLFF